MSISKKENGAPPNGARPPTPARARRMLRTKSTQRLVDAMNWKRPMADQLKSQPKLPHMKPSHSRVNKKKFVDSGDFLSHDLRLPKGPQQSLARMADKVASVLVDRKYFRDVPKSPYYKMSSMRGAMLSITALNAYLGTNLANLPNGAIERRSYGYLTSIVTGLDTRAQQVCPVFPELAEMMRTIQAALLDSGYNLNELDIDMISIKVYYTYVDPRHGKRVTKLLNPHTDVKYNPDGSVMANANGDNCQHPGLPVVIYNIGSKKRLHFQLRDWYTDLPIAGEEFYILQTNHHAFVLNAYDETPDVRGKTMDAKYLSYWAHDASLMEDDGISISIQFRFGNCSAAFDSSSNVLVRPSLSDSVSAKFDHAAANHPWMRGPEYEKEIERIHWLLRKKFVTKK